MGRVLENFAHYVEETSYAAYEATALIPIRRNACLRFPFHFIETTDLRQAPACDYKQDGQAL